MISDNSSEKLVDRAAQLVAAAKHAGADHADAVVIRARSVSVSVRLGKVEGTESSESDDFSLRVLSGAVSPVFLPMLAAIPTNWLSVRLPWRVLLQKIRMSNWPIPHCW